jgi:hypothetical protein
MLWDYAECQYAQLHSSFTIMLSVVMLSVIMLSVVMLSVIMLSVIMLNVIMLSVIVLSVIMLSVVMLSVVAPFRNHYFIYKITLKVIVTSFSVHLHILKRNVVVFYYEVSKMVYFKEFYLF